MDYYHGTAKKDLKYLLPFASQHSNLKEACVYLTTNRQVSLFYIWNYEKLPIRTLMLDIRENVVVFQEMYSGALELFYKGLSGYIYHCIGEYEMSENHGVRTCAISNESVPVTDVGYIEDVWKKS